MPSWLKSTLQYIFSLSIGGFLLWWVFRGANLTSLVSDLVNTDLKWVLISYLIALSSHVLRAYRWNLLMEPLGFRPSLLNSTLAVLTGYLANIAFPRMGEVSRCAVLQKTDAIPVNTGFGTVVTERIFDLFTLIFITLITIILEFKKLSGFVFSLFEQKLSTVNFNRLIIIGLLSMIFILTCLFLLFKFVRNRFKTAPGWEKIRNFLRGLMEGFLSFRKLKKKFEFLISTILIWTGYFFMSYVMFYAVSYTSGLGIKAGLAVLVLGGLGMAAPVQGGIGAYHWIIQHGLVLYGLTLNEGRVFATIVHSSQMLMMIGLGLLSLAIIPFVSRKKPIALSSESG